MRRYLYIFIAVAMAACSDNATTEELNVGEGRVSFSLVASRTVEDNNTNTYTIPAELMPTEDDFAMRLTGEYIDITDLSLAEYDQSFDNIHTYNTSNDGDVPYLAAGDYTVTLSYGGEISTESATNLCMGATADFTLEARENDAQVALTAKLLNSIVRIQTTEYFDKYFSDVTLVASTESYSSTLTYDPIVENLLFLAPETNIYLSGEGYKQPSTESGEGLKVTFARTKVGTTKSCTMSTILVDAKEAGGATIEITIDDVMSEIEGVTIELNN